MTIQSVRKSSSRPTTIVLLPCQFCTFISHSTAAIIVLTRYHITWCELMPISEYKAGLSLFIAIH